MNIGIIGYGSMGKMLADKFALSGRNVYVSTRTRGRLESAPRELHICQDNTDTAQVSDIIFVCVRPCDLLNVISGIDGAAKDDALIVSLNGSVSFAAIRGVTSKKTAKVIPSVTAEIDRSQTLVTYSEFAGEEDKARLKELLSIIGNVIELPENEMGMGSELVSCMPGFIASMFDVVCESARKHTDIPDDQIVNMVLNTMSATGDLMLQKDMSFKDVVGRVATKGGITEVGTSVIYDQFPDTADELFGKTMAKRRKTSLESKKEG